MKPQSKRTLDTKTLLSAAMLVALGGAAYACSSDDTTGSQFSSGWSASDDAAADAYVGSASDASLLEDVPSFVRDDASMPDEGVASHEAAAPACATPPASGRAACDRCILGGVPDASAGCAASWCACANDSTMGDGGAGVSGCVAWVDCVRRCVSGDPDAGIAPQGMTRCAYSCNGGPSARDYSSSASIGLTFVACLLQSCPSECF